MDEAREWYSRTLDSFYPVVFLDAVHYKVREEGRIVTKAAYVALGINAEGRKDILGIWIGENEGDKFWLKVCNELKNRGVRNILITRIGGLQGARLQSKRYSLKPGSSYVLYQIRNTMKKGLDTYQFTTLHSYIDSLPG